MPDWMDEGPYYLEGMYLKIYFAKKRQINVAVPILVTKEFQDLPCTHSQIQMYIHVNFQC